MNYADSLEKLPLGQALNRMNRYRNRKPVLREPSGLTKHALGCAKKWVRQAARLRRHMDLAKITQRKTK